MRMGHVWVVLVLMSLPSIACGGVITSRPTRAMVVAGRASAASIPPGTPVQVSLTSDIRSNDRSAARAQFVVYRDVTVNDQVVIAQGSPVDAEIRTHSSLALGAPGYVEADMRATVGVDGGYIPLTGQTRIDGSERVGSVVGLSIGFFFLFGPFSLFFLFVHGTDIALEAGVLVNAFVGAGAQSVPPTTSP